MNDKEIIKTIGHTNLLPTLISASDFTEAMLNYPINMHNNPVIQHNRIKVGKTYTGQRDHSALGSSGKDIRDPML